VTATKKKAGAVVALLTVLVAAAVMVASTASAAGQPIVIGWAFDSKGAMAPFDGPALAAAQIRVNQWNAKGGVKGRPLKIVTCDTQGNKPAIAKSCAAKLIGQKADIIFTTCDVDFAAPVVQEAINAGKLTVAPCIGTDQMGPKRFGAKGKLAFSFGNVAQDEGSAMAQYARAKGWKTAALATDTVIVYFKDVIKAFKARFTQLGGKIVAEESYQSLGSTSQQNVITRLNSKKADVIVTSTAGAFGALPQILAGLRSLDNNTPMLNSWAGDGTYWVTKEPTVSNYYFVTYASIFGDDPNKAVTSLAKKVKAGTGGFVTGSAAIDGVVAAINRSGGSTNGAVLAATMEKFTKVPTLSGLVSFSPTLHSVFGRQYRVIKIQDNNAKVVGSVTAKVVPKIPTCRVRSRVSTPCRASRSRFIVTRSLG
jgi:branched-chain amino acid transport system substrate-binding protein